MVGVYTVRIHTNQQPFISIIIPSYNRSHLISNAIDSILMQDFSEYEIIICDDSDNDKTEVLLKEKYHDRRIRYIKNNPPLKNGYKNFINAALNYANGLWIAILSDDDYYFDTNALSKIYNLTNKHVEIDAIFLDCANDYGFATVFDYDKDLEDLFQKTDILKYPTIEPVFSFKKSLLQNLNFPKAMSKPFDNFILIDFLIANYKLGYLQNFGQAFRIASDNLNKHKRNISEFISALSFFEASYNMLAKKFTKNEIEKIFTERFAYLKNSATLFSKKYEDVLDTIFDRLLIDVPNLKPIDYIDSFAAIVGRLCQEEIDKYVEGNKIFAGESYLKNSEKISKAKKVAIYGAAFMGRQIAKQYKQKGIEVVCFIDDFVGDLVIDGIKVVKVCNFDQIHEVDYCIIASGKIDLIERMCHSLRAIGFDDEKVIAIG